jgi:hypothetical protein
VPPAGEPEEAAPAAPEPVVAAPGVPAPVPAGISELEPELMPDEEPEVVPPELMPELELPELMPGDEPELILPAPPVPQAASTKAHAIGMIHLVIKISLKIK